MAEHSSTWGLIACVAITSCSGRLRHTGFNVLLNVPVVSRRLVRVLGNQLRQLERQRCVEDQDLSDVGQCMGDLVDVEGPLRVISRPGRCQQFICIRAQRHSHSDQPGKLPANRFWQRVEPFEIGVCSRKMLPPHFSKRLFKPLPVRDDDSVSPTNSAVEFFERVIEDVRQRDYFESHHMKDYLCGRLAISRDLPQLAVRDFLRLLRNVDRLSGSAPRHDTQVHRRDDRDDGHQHFQIDLAVWPRSADVRKAEDEVHA